MRTAFVVGLISLAAPAAAHDFFLTFPLDCTLNKTCYIQQYVDRDPGPGSYDFACGGLSYDGHKGTDFALPSLAAMERGVAVLAAAPGQVVRLRDGVPDTGREGMPEGQDCGNGVVIRHKEGWESQYCHLKRESITVTRGDQVQAGDVLGQVGYSGATEFPHMHLSLRRDGAIIDPFDPQNRAKCGPDSPMWQPEITYRPGGLLTMGFSAAIPEYAAVKLGTAHISTLRSDAPALVVWVLGFGARTGDVLHLVIDGPTGPVIDRTIKLDRNQALYFRATGRQRRGDHWPVGRYDATATLTRDGVLLETRKTSISRE
ncbi:MAG: M23 family metallopeptidase [Rhodobacteraceae bacterium]|nr:M23 family metallopeptidase [Paracoccaceae bacterium]